MQTNTRIDAFIKNPKRALFTLALPIIIGQLVHSLYTVIDTIFVGRLGPEAIAAITLSFPLFFLMNAFGFGTAVGITQRVGFHVGEKKKGSAENAALHGILINLIYGVIFFFIGLFFIGPLFSLFNADALVTELGISYTNILFLFAPLFFLSMALFAILAGEGDTKTPMVAQVLSLIINIILDPIFIFWLGYGVKGAALATIIAHAIGLLFLCYRYLYRNNGYLKLTWSAFRYQWEVVRGIFRIGTPVILMMLVMTLGIILLNAVLTSFGTSVVAAFGLAARLDSFVMMPIMGFAGALVALVSIFLGANRPDLIRFISWYGIRVSILVSVVMGIIFFSIPHLLLRLFTSDPELIEIAVVFIRFFAFTYPIMAVTMTSGRIIQGLGSGIPGLVITSVRVLLVAIPLAYFFVKVLGYGYVSVLVALVISGLVSMAVAIPWLRHHLKKVEKGTGQ